MATESTANAKPRPGFQPWNLDKRVVVEQDGWLCSDGRLSLNKEYTMIIKIEGAWHEIWCPYCGANCLSTGIFLRSAALLATHIRNAHFHKLPVWLQIPPREQGPNFAVEICCKIALSEDELLKLNTGAVVPRRVPHKRVTS